MDYEKKYNEALEWMRGVYPTLTGAVKEDAEHYFPELRESEDERIRKYILRACEETIEGGGKGLELSMDTTKKLAAYLEKQKEQKPISSCDIVPYIDDKIAALQDMWREEKVAFDWDDMHEMIEDVARHFYQKEQKPAEKQDYSGLNDPERAILRGFLAAGVENAPVGIIKDTAKECITQMKPAEWSEEDEKLYNSALWHIKNSCGNGGKNSGEFTVYNWLKNRVKSLRPQPKQEWSEEEERILKGIIGKIDHDQTYGVSKVEMLSFLEGLRPSWKVSVLLGNPARSR